MTDRRTSAAHAASQQAAPFRDGALDVERLPVIESRDCQPVGELTTHLIDALAERGYSDLVADPLTGLTRAPSVSSGTSVTLSLVRALVRALGRPEMPVMPGKSHRWVPRCHLRQGTSAGPDRLSGLVGTDSLTLTFPAEAYAAR